MFAVILPPTKMHKHKWVNNVGETNGRCWQFTSKFNICILLLCRTTIIWAALLKYVNLMQQVFHCVEMHWQHFCTYVFVILIDVLAAYLNWLLIIMPLVHRYRMVRGITNMSHLFKSNLIFHPSVTINSLLCMSVGMCAPISLWLG